MKLSKSFLVIITIVIFSTLSFLTGIQFEKLTSKTNPPQTETTQIPQLPQSPQLPQEVTVVRVVDGDTLELSTGQPVRLTGINTPEVNQPFHDQATEFTRKLILNQKVRLEYEKGYEQDKFGRLLAYVFVTNSPKVPYEVLVNLELVKAGLAKVSVYEKRRPLIYQNQLFQAQSEAKKNKLGIWVQQK